MTTYTVTAGHGPESAEFRDCMEYLLTLFAAEQAALSAVHLHRRRTGACPPHLVEAALTRSEELARGAGGVPAPVLPDREPCGCRR